MYFETMIARSEHQLMQAEAAQIQTRDGVIVECERTTQRGTGLIARIRSLVSRPRVSDQPKHANRTATASAR